MLYRFDLKSDDYVAMNLASSNTKTVVRGYLPYALVPSAALWILVHDVAGIPALLSAILAAALLFGILGYYALTWRRTFAAAITKYHEGPRRSILGPHTLELGDDGLHSVGPLHRSFRAWESIIGVVTSRTYIFFHTSFGVVYVLPARAVDDMTGLISVLEARKVTIAPGGV